MLLNYSPPTSPYLTIHYQDNDLLIVDKPAGLLTVPGKDPAHKDSLERRVQRVFPTAKIVHRLDMATSGLLVMALNKITHRELSKQFQARKTQKHYIAVIGGTLVEKTGSVDLPLICDWPNRPKQKVDFDNGKPSLTHWEVLSSRQHPDVGMVTRVKLTPITGRSHQLRVHMQQLGHPIIGDRLYATETLRQNITRLHLHAEALSFEHPSSHTWLTFQSPCPF